MDLYQFLKYNWSTRLQGMHALRGKPHSYGAANKVTSAF